MPVSKLANRRRGLKAGAIAVVVALFAALCTTTVWALTSNALATDPNDAAQTTQVVDPALDADQTLTPPLSPESVSEVTTEQEAPVEDAAAPQQEESYVEEAPVEVAEEEPVVEAEPQAEVVEQTEAVEQAETQAQVETAAVDETPAETTEQAAEQSAEPVAETPAEPVYPTVIDKQSSFEFVNNTPTRYNDTTIALDSVGARDVVSFDLRAYEWTAFSTANGSVFDDNSLTTIAAQDQPAWEPQSAPTFYVLLPAGTEPDQATLKAYQVLADGTTGAQIADYNIVTNTIADWRSSGRTMLVVTVNAGADNYVLDYNALTAISGVELSFDAYESLTNETYGQSALVSAVYDSGNTGIAGGVADNCATLSGEALADSSLLYDVNNDGNPTGAHGSAIYAWATVPAGTTVVPEPEPAPEPNEQEAAANAIEETAEEPAEAESEQATETVESEPAESAAADETAASDAADASEAADEAPVASVAADKLTSAKTLSAKPSKIAAPANDSDEELEDGEVKAAASSSADADAANSSAAADETDDSDDEDEEAITALVASTSDSAYSVELTFGEDAGIPQDATVQVSVIDEDSDEYAAAREAVAATMDDADAAAFGMAALDITIYDAQGNKVEPAEGASVQVKISMEDFSATLPAGADESTLAIRHITNDGSVQTVAAASDDSTGTVALDQDGALAAEFETESFSTFVATYALGAANPASTSDYTVAVGSTITIDASEDLTSTPNKGTVNTWSWSSDDPSVATISGSTSTGTVKGVAAGTATITVTHTYSTNKNKTTTESKTYTVQVTDSGSSSSSEEETLTGNGGNITVTVKHTGTVKKLQGLYLIVKKLSSGSDYNAYLSAFTAAGGDQNNLKGMYHIYLSNNADGSGNEVSVSNVNLDVTIIDSDLNGVSTAKVGHFKKNSSGTVETQSVDGTAAIKSVTVSDGSITFRIQSFSVFTISTEDSTSTDSTTGIVTSHTQGGTTVVNTDDSAQINYAYESYAVNGTGVKKTISATGTENVFKVTIEATRRPSESMLQEYLQSAGGIALQSNSQAEDPGKIVENYDPQSKDYVFYSTDQEKGSVKVNYKLTNADGSTQTITTTLYQGPNANTGTYHGILVPLPDGTWISIYHTQFGDKKMESASVEI